MEVAIRRAVSERDIDKFIDLPFELYRSSPRWIPPIKKQEKELLTTHPFWNTARKELFLASVGGETVGRICALIDEKYNAYSGENCGAFGFFECRDDQAAADALLGAARGWLVDQGAAFMRGPLNPSANYTCGLLVEGFDLDPGLMMPWNPPYYPRLFETWLLRKEQDLYAYHIDRDGLKLPPWLAAEIARLKDEKRFEYRVSSKKTLAADAAAMLEIYRESWAENWGFSPLSPEEAKFLVKELTELLDPEFFVLFYHRGEPAAGMVALPNLNPLLKKLNGKIGLTAPWHYFRSGKEIKKSYRIMLFGILPEYRLMGLPLLLLDYMLEKARIHKEIEWIEGGWVLESNFAIDDLIEDFSGKIRKRYRIYRRDVAPCQL